MGISFCMFTLFIFNIPKPKICLLTRGMFPLINFVYTVINAIELFIYVVLFTKNLLSQLTNNFFYLSIQCFFGLYAGFMQSQIE